MDKIHILEINQDENIIIIKNGEIVSRNKSACPEQPQRTYLVETTDLTVCDKRTNRIVCCGICTIIFIGLFLGLSIEKC